MQRVLALALLIMAALAATAHAGPIEDTCIGVGPRLGGPCRGARCSLPKVAAPGRYAALTGDETCTTQAASTPGACASRRAPRTWTRCGCVP